jgi:hypothetical protein
MTYVRSMSDVEAARIVLLPAHYGRMGSTEQDKLCVGEEHTEIYV